MGTLTTLLSEQTVQRIGWTLLHFLWQGTVVMALTWCVLKILSKTASNTRYTVACVGLALMVLAPIITFAVLNSDSTPSPVFETAAVRQETPTPQPPVQTQNSVIVDEKPAPPQRSMYEMLTARIEAALPGCVTGWLIGVTALSLWYLGGWCQLQRLRRIGTKTVSDALAQTTAELARRLGIQRVVRIAESALVQVPTVIGHLRPVILLPVSALTGLDEIQLKAMIAHELAHIRRCDYLVNIAQTVIEILGFYHPAVWWASRRIRIERENACDDTAIGLVQSRKQYAKALFSMEAVRAKQHDLAIAANGAPLTHRISRIIDKNANQNPTSGWIPPFTAALILLILIVSVSLAAKQDTPNDTAAAMMDKEKVAAFLKDFEQAVQNGDRQTVEQSLYFENDAIRQKAQPYITDMLNDSVTLVTNFRIIRVEQSADSSLSVFGLYPIQGKMYVTNTLPVKIENGRYQLNLFNADFFEKTERAKTQTPQQFGRIVMQEELDKWQNADREELNKLIQTLIVGEQNNLAAAQYAEDNNLQMMPHLTIPEINQRLDLYKNTDPEQLRQQIIEDCTKALNDEKNPQPETAKAAIKSAQSDSQSSLKILNTELDPVAQGKNVLYATVKNTSDAAQLFAIHIQTRSPDYGPEGVGWGTVFFETLKPNETKRARFVYKIQGPVTDNTYIRVKYYNPPSEADYEYEQPFAERFYKQSYRGMNLSKRQIPQTLHPAPKANFEEIAAVLKTIQNAIRAKDYEMAWDAFTTDYHKGEYQIRGIEWFKRQMEPTHPLDSGFIWAKEDFLKLQPVKAGYERAGVLKLQAACDDQRWTLDFAKEDNRWKIDWISGYRPAVLDMQEADAAKNDTETEMKAIRLDSMQKLKKLGLAYYGFMNDNDKTPPSDLNALQPYLDSETAQWLAGNAVLFNVTQMPQPEALATTPIAYDKTLPDSQNGTTVLYADGHVEFLEKEHLEDIVGANNNDSPQILTTGYLVIVPVDLPQLKNVYSKDKPIMISPEALAEFLDVIQNNPQAKILAVPKVLTNNNQSGEVRIADESGPDSIKLNVKNNITSDGKCVKVEVDFKHLISGDIGPSTINASGTTVLLSDYASVLGGCETKEGIELFLIQPKILDKPSDPQKSQQITPDGFDGGFTPANQIQASQNRTADNTPTKNVIYGTVLDTHGKPASGALILPMPHGGDPVLTDAQGRFQLPGPSQDPAVDRRIDFLLVRHPQTNQAAVAYLESAEMPLNVQLQPALTLVGRVTDTDDNPIGGVKVELSVHHTGWKANFGYTPFNRTNINGTFEIPALPVELEYSLQAREPGYNSYEERLGQFTNPGRVELETIVLEQKQQVAIEARILTVPDYFMEDIGMDTASNPDEQAAVGVGNIVVGLANTQEIRAALEPKPLPNKQVPIPKKRPLDDQQTNFLTRATQAYRNAKVLTAPKVCVLNGESANLQIQSDVTYMDIDDKQKTAKKGIMLDLLPVIQNDDNKILLKGQIQLSDILENRSIEYNGNTYEIPYMQVANIPIYAMVESSGTVLIESPEMTSIKEIKGPTPTTTRPYNYQPRVTHKQRLLILIKPTIIEQIKQEVPASPPSGGGLSYDQLPGMLKEEK